MSSLRHKTVVAILVAAAFVAPAAANTIWYSTGSVNLTGSPSGWVNAQVGFNINHVTDTVLISIVNLHDNPISVGQLVSRVDFTLSHFTNTSPEATIVTERATKVEIDSMGRMVEVDEELDTDWKILPIATGRFDLCTICTGSSDPDELLIGGPASNDRYTSANGSIAGNNAHNPFLMASGDTYTDGPLAGLTSTPTWTVRINGIQSTTFIGSVRVGFGTSYNALTAPAYEMTETPEPGTVVLFGCGIGVIAFAQWRKKKGQAA